MPTFFPTSQLEKKLLIFFIVNLDILHFCQNFPLTNSYNNNIPKYWLSRKLKTLIYISCELTHLMTIDWALHSTLSRVCIAFPKPQPDWRGSYNLPRLATTFKPYKFKKKTTLLEENLGREKTEKYITAVLLSVNECVCMC